MRGTSPVLTPTRLVVYYTMFDEREFCCLRDSAVNFTRAYIEVGRPTVPNIDTVYCCRMCNILDRYQTAC